MGSKNKLPDYYEQQAAFHEAFRTELYSLINQLPSGGRVLDVPCGDGFYSLHFVKLAAKLVASDASSAFLKLARKVLSKKVQVRKADIYRLPFDDSEFDLVWCAESLISLEKPEVAVRELARVTRPGGVLAVLEADEFHHVLLPWPVELEVAIHRAVLEASETKFGDRMKLSPSRRIRKMLLEEGMKPRKMTVAADRQAPLSEAETTFLTHYLRSLDDFISPYLRAKESTKFQRFVDGLFQDEELEMTCLNVVHIGHKPDRASTSRDLL